MSLKTFMDAYVEAALWSSMDESNEQGGEPLDANHGPEDIAVKTRMQMEADCRAFYREWEGTWTEGGGYWRDDAQAGHDFWLSRNGHGAGFFDRPSAGDAWGKKTADALQRGAMAYGSFDLYIGDDGLIYGG